jgi:hypothetical protein
LSNDHRIASLFHVFRTTETSEKITDSGNYGNGISKNIADSGNYGNKDFRNVHWIEELHFGYDFVNLTQESR